jgi:predicted dehydrogenase
VQTTRDSSSISPRNAVAPFLAETRYIVAERLGVFVPRSLDVDVLLDLMIHDLNLVLSLMRQPVIDVRAVGIPVLTEKVDITNVRLELANGAVANLTASRVSQERVRKLRFFSRKIYISVDTKEQEVHGFRLSGRSVEPIEVNVEKKEPLRAELEAFVRCVQTRETPLVTGQDGLEAVELAHRVAAAIDESLRKLQ